MKYILLTAAALFAVFLLSFIITSMIRRKLTKKPPRAVHILISIVCGVLIIAVIGLIYLNIYSPAESDALQTISQNSATITETDYGYFFDSESENTALVFYPGAKVDEKAYAPLMQKLADGGVDCFLLKMPFHMAIFDMNAADKVISVNNYDTWILAGHSMGGVAASTYAAEHTDTVDGLVLLASYPNEQIPDNIAVLSLYGSEDSVLEKDAYEGSKHYFPATYDEVVIDGGNHAEFADYGEQKGDGIATLSAEEQQTKTAYAILSFINDIQ